MKRRWSSPEPACTPPQPREPGEFVSDSIFAVFLRVTELEKQSHQQSWVCGVDVEGAPCSVCRWSPGPRLTLMQQRPCGVFLTPEACRLS